MRSLPTNADRVAWGRRRLVLDPLRILRVELRPPLCVLALEGVSHEELLSVVPDRLQCRSRSERRIGRSRNAQQSECKDYRARQPHRLQHPLEQAKPRM
jgi:hypothetical protein